MNKQTMPHFCDSDVVNRDEWAIGSSKGNAYLIHDHGFTVAVVIADSVDDAIGYAVDAGKMTRWEVSDDQQVSDYTDADFDSGRLEFIGTGTNRKVYDLEGMSVVVFGLPKVSFVACFEAHDYE